MDIVTLRRRLRSEREKSMALLADLGDSSWVSAFAATSASPYSALELHRVSRATVAFLVELNLQSPRRERWRTTLERRHRMNEPAEPRAPRGVPRIGAAV